VSRYIEKLSAEPCNPGVEVPFRILGDDEGLSVHNGAAPEGTRDEEAVP